MRCRWSLKVSRRARPILSQVADGSGSVAIISE
jgi:hypothetical protein